MSYPAPVKNFTRTSGTADTTPARTPDVPRNARSCVKLTNTGANAIYVYLTSQSASAPTISGAAFDFVINPDEFLVFPAGDSVAVWIATLASTATFEMLEADGDPAAFAASSVSGSATISGTVALASEGVEDSAAGSGFTGIRLLAVRNDAGANLTSDDGDLSGIAVTSTGQVKTEARAEGLLDHDATPGSAVKPVVLGGKGFAADFAAISASGDITQALFSLLGKLITMPYALPARWVFGTATSTGTSPVEVIAAQAAGIRTNITSIQLTNTSSTASAVQILDGATLVTVITVPANSGAIVHFPVPLRGSAATAWNFDPLTAATTIYCSMQGFTSTGE